MTDEARTEAAARRVHKAWTAHVAEGRIADGETPLEPIPWEHVVEDWKACCRKMALAAADAVSIPEHANIQAVATEDYATLREVLLDVAGRAYDPNELIDELEAAIGKWLKRARAVSISTDLTHEDALHETIAALAHDLIVERARDVPVSEYQQIAVRWRECPSNGPQGPWQYADSPHHIATGIGLIEIQDVWVRKDDAT